jgi:sugar lactone lactonase YvrE
MLVSLAAAGHAATPNITASNTTFPTIALGQSTTQTVTVTLNAALALKTIALGPNVTEYSLGTVTGCTVDGTTVNVLGSVCSIPVTYTPKALGSSLAPSTARGAPLQVTDIESGNPVVYSFGLLGGATGPIMEFSPATITLVAGVPATGYAAGDNGLGLTTGGYGGTGGPATSATFNFTSFTGTEDEYARQPMAIDSAGNIFVYDDGNNIIRRIDAVTTNVTTVAGVPDAAPYTYSGDGGPATSAGIGGLVAMTMDAADNIYFSNYGTAAGDGSQIIRRVDGGSGIITGVAGQNFSDTEFGDTLCPDVGIDTTWEPTCGDGGPAATAFIYYPTALAIDAAGNIYILQSSGNIRKIDAATGIITTLVSVGPGANVVFGMAFGADGFLYVAFDDPTLAPDSELIAKIDPSSGTQTVVMGSATAQPSPTTCTQSGSLGTNWFLDFGDANNPGLSADGAGNVYAGTYDCSAGTGIFGYIGEFRYNVTSGLAYAWTFGESGGGGGQNGVFDSWGDLYSMVPAYAVGDSAGDIYFMTNNQIAKLSGTQGALNGFGSRYDFQMDAAGFTCSENGSYCETAVISNIGNAALTTSLTLDPNWVYLNTGDSSACTGSSLAPGEFCNLDLEFSPTEVGTVDGNLTLTDNATTQEDGTQNLALVGTGVAAALANLTPATWNFNTVADGNSATKTFVLSNPGTAALDIYDLYVSFTTPQEFSETNTCGTSLGAGGSCNIVVTFTPTATSGTFTSTLTVEESVGSGTLTASLSGTAGPAATPAATLTPIAFGGLIKGTTSAPMTATLTNTGTAGLTITGITVTGTNASDFAITTGTNACAASLAAGDSCFIYATFTPSLVGGETATLNVADNAPGSPQTAALSGTGVVFSSNVGTAQATQTLAVTFTTAGTLSQIHVLTQGAANKDFTETAGGSCATGTAYTVGESCTVDVVFDPLAPGIRHGAILLTDSTGDILSTTYLPGIGTGPQIAFAPASQTSLLPASTYTAYGVAIDGAGDLYTTDNAGGTLIELPKSASGFGAPVTIATGLNEPLGVAVDGAGNVFVADYANLRIVEIPWTGTAFGTPTTVPLGTTTREPRFLKVDGLGNLYFTDYAFDVVLEIPWTGSGYGTPVVLPFTGQNSVNGIAVDQNGDVFVADTYGHNVLELPWTGSAYGTQVALVSGLEAGAGAPVALTLDAADNLYVAEEYTGFTGTDELLEVPATGGGSYGTPFVIPIALDSVTDVALDASGNIYVADRLQQQVFKLDVADGPSLNFASTQVGSESTDSPRTVTVSNIGNAPLVFAAAPAYPTDFPQDAGGTNLCASGTSVASAASCDLSVDFKPTKTGSPLQENLVLTDNALNVGGATQTLSLTGDATPATAPTATLTGISFGSEVDGTTTAAMTATLTNTSTTTTLTISGITITGTNAADFAMTTGTNACGTSLAANTSCFIYATFKPSLVGPESATLNMADNATGSPQTAPLSGTGTAALPPVSVSPSALAYGGVQINTTSFPLSIEVTANSGSVSLAGSAITGTAAFALTTGANACTTSTTLASGQSCSFYVTFTPTGTIEPYAGTLGIGATGQTVSLTGQGISFGSKVGTAQAAQSVTVFITTAGTLDSIQVLTQGIAGLDFTLGSGGTCATGTAYTAGETCTVNVVFKPRFPGERFGAVQLYTPTAGSAPIGSTLLSGVGKGPMINFGIETAPGTFTPTTTTTFSFNAGANVAVDPNHNLYVTAGNTILEATAASGYQTTNNVVAASSPQGLALDGAGDLIWTDYGSGQILEVAAVNGVIPANPTPVPLGSGWSVPWSSVVDAQGDVFVANTGNNPGLYEIVAVNGAVSSSSTVQLIENTYAPLWMAFDSHGNLFFTGQYQHACVYEIPQVGGQILAATPSQQVACGFGLPLSIAVDAAGNLWEADFYSGVSKVEAVNGVIPASPTIFDYGTYAFGLGLDENGNVFWTTYEGGNQNTLIEYDFADPPSFAWSGQTNVGTTDSTVYTAYAVNDGNQPLALSVPSTGDNPAINVNWIWATTSTGACPSVAAGGTAADIAEGVQCELPISFAPQNGGTLTGDLTFTDNNLNVSGATQNIGLTGDGVGSLPPTATLTGISFGSEVDGTTTAAMTATLTNTSTSTALTISGITITGANAGDFTMATGTNACGTSLAANSSCFVCATFKPSLVGAESATLNVADNATGSPQTAALSGTGTAAVVTATLTGISFGSEVDGTTTAAMTATLTNTSTTTALTIGGITITGTNASDFAMTTGTNACGSSLAAKASCFIYATFKPSLVGSESATLNVADSATGSPQTAALTGTGTAPPPTATLTGISFGSEVDGTTTAAMTATLTNTSTTTTTALTISSITITGTNGDDFSKTTGTNACGASLAANTSCKIYATFTPSLVGAESATLGVNDNATGSPQTAALTGTGTAPLAPAASLSPTTLAFGNQTVNTTSAAMTTTLSNTGTGPLSISSIYLNEPSEDDGVVKAKARPLATGGITISSSPDYSATTTCGATLAAGANCTISVTFDPSTTGSLPGTLSVSDNASGSPQTATLTGTGYTGGNFTVASPTAPQTVKPGGSAQYTINVSVTPNGDIFNNAVTLTASGLPASATASFSPVSVTPGTGTAASTMTVHTSSTNAMLAPFKDGSKWPIPSSLALMFGGAWALFRRKHRDQFANRERFARIVSLALLLGAMGAATMGLMGCGAGFAQYQPKTYTITVTGTSGTQTQTTTVQLTVE